jgi:hypothetical protein
VYDLDWQVFQHLHHSVANVIVGIQVLLYVELGKPQTCSFFLPWYLGQKLGPFATAFHKGSYMCHCSIVMYLISLVFLRFLLDQAVSSWVGPGAEFCRRALLVQNLPMSLLCCKILRTRFTRLHRSGGRVCVSVPVSEGLDLGRPRGICPERVVELGCTVQGCN